MVHKTKKTNKLYYTADNPNSVTFGPFGLEILGLTNRQLKEKQYEVLKCVVLDNNDVLADLANL